MDFDIDTQIKKLRPYLWICYPIVTTIIVVIALSYLVGSSNSLTDRLGRANRKIQENIKLKATLETKLSTLKSVQEQALADKLKTLIESMPIDREIWTAISKLRTVGNLTSFRNSGNQTITVEYEVEDSIALQKLLEKIDELKPLMSVADVSFGAKKARLEIEVANLPK